MTHRLVSLTFHVPPQDISPLRMRGHQDLLREGEGRGLFRLLPTAGAGPAPIALAPAAAGAALIAFLARDPLLAGGLASYHFTAAARPEPSAAPWGRLRKGA